MPVLGESIGGRYRLEAVIGRGGMSTVYRALDTVLERPVAIKLLHPGVAADADQLERFRREARLVARLSHPHVVTVIDAGEQPGGPDGDGSDPTSACPYIVFEYVEGETLKELIRREGPLEIPRAVAYALELARALGAAHAHDLVHRDVKPQNVLITEEGARQDHRLRDRPPAHRGGADDAREGARDDRLHRPRAGARRAGERPLGPLLARDRAVRDAHRRRPLPRGVRRWRWR